MCVIAGWAGRAGPRDGRAERSLNAAQARPTTGRRGLCSCDGRAMRVRSDRSLFNATKPSEEFRGVEQPPPARYTCTVWPSSLRFLYRICIFCSRLRPHLTCGPRTSRGRGQARGPCARLFRRAAWKATEATGMRIHTQSFGRPPARAAQHRAPRLPRAWCAATYAQQRCFHRHPPSQRHYCIVPSHLQLQRSRRRRWMQRRRLP